MTEELKSCPFCGDEAYLSHAVYYGVHCRSCSAETRLESNAKDAIHNWNRRVLDEAIKIIMEQLRSVE